MCWRSNFKNIFAFFFISKSLSTYSKPSQKLAPVLLLNVLKMVTDERLVACLQIYQKNKT